MSRRKKNEPITVRGLAESRDGAYVTVDVIVHRPDVLALDPDGVRDEVMNLADYAIAKLQKGVVVAEPAHDHDFSKIRFRRSDGTSDAFCATCGDRQKPLAA